ncbi:expressed unknown protein [Seminavis robusta]|uniref:Uncharacterized protein n=1 Tax=Seminavis robusta TaxID=568900 RepID=A0A9N8DHS5_9STRA|nr:expressed unknown protein [Seminavis robusta]|eukprot:Sro159_g071910.1 n/a (417) ;mRNA; r:76514-78127
MGAAKHHRAAEKQPCWADLVHEFGALSLHYGMPQAPSSGTTTALEITSVTPDESFWPSVAHIVRRITTDCHASVQENKYPDLVISNGDMPGMIRAKLGGIPSASIAHGQLFRVAEKPDFVTEDDHLDKAWDREDFKNFAASFFAQWTIATHFCYLQSKMPRGSVVQTPLRQEVITMASARQLAPASFNKIPRGDEVEKLLIEEYPLISRRRLVICYFRDKNGQSIIDALLASGFNVLLMVDETSGSDETTKVKVMGTSGQDPTSPYLIQVADRQLFLPLMHVVDGVASSADDEQHLNVELSRQCQQTQVFGTSFESFESRYGKRRRAASDWEPNTDNLLMSEKRFQGFEEAVQMSQMSDMYFDFLEGQKANPQHIDNLLAGIEGSMPGAVEGAMPGVMDIIRDILQELNHQEPVSS